MAGDGPENERGSGDTGSDKDGHPDSSAEEKLLDIWLADMQRAEGRRFGLT